MGRKPVLIPSVQQLLSQYNIRLTVRQIFYRLVTKSIIPNTLIAYNTLDRELTKARWDGRIPFTALEDRARSFQGGEGFWHTPPEKHFEESEDDYESAEESFRKCVDSYDLPLWHGQPKYVEVWLEKDALASIFSTITEKYNVRLAPCRGYPSLSFLHKAATYFKHEVPNDKEIWILYFGDFDVRGIDIQRHIEETLARMGLSAHTQRIALTKEQIIEHKLPPQPSKKLDTMARGWIEAHGDVAWELDALDPQVLVQLIESNIEQNMNKIVSEQRVRLIREGRQRIASLVREYFGDD